MAKESLATQVSNAMRKSLRLIGELATLPANSPEAIATWKELEVAKKEQERLFSQYLEEVKLRNKGN